VRPIAGGDQGIAIADGDGSQLGKFLITRSLPVLAGIVTVEHNPPANASDTIIATADNRNALLTDPNDIV
jgi:hypothetical protein